MGIGGAALDEMSQSSKWSFIVTGTFLTPPAAAPSEHVLNLSAYWTNIDL